MSFSPMISIVAASVATNGLRRPGRGLPPEPEHDDINKALLVVLTLMIAVLGFVVLLNVTAVETSSLISVKVVEAVTEVRGKSKTRELAMTVELDGKRWVPNERVESDKCPNVVYNTPKPVYYRTRHTWLSDDRWVTGLSTFCKR